MSVDVALSMVGGALAAAITAGPAWIGIRRANRNLGQTNGYGPIAHMVEATLLQLGEMRGDVSRLRTLVEGHVVDQAIHRRGVEANTWYDDVGATDGGTGDGPADSHRRPGSPGQPAPQGDSSER